MRKAKRPRKLHGRERKEKALRYVLGRGITVAAASRRLCISRNTLRYWLWQLRKRGVDSSYGGDLFKALETQRLRKERAQEFYEQEFLNASRRVADKGAASKARFISANENWLSLKRRCELLGMPMSTYYAARNRPMSNRERSNRELWKRIREVYRENHRTYGSRRICAELRKEGLRCSVNRVARLMKEHGMRAVQHRKNRGR